MHRRSTTLKLLSPLLLTAGLYGCGSDGVTPPPPQANAQGSLQTPTAAKTLAGGASAASGSGAGSQKQSTNAIAAPTIPAGAKYTIVCAQFGGASHIAESKAAKERLISQTGRGDFYLLHDDGRSTLYFGYYSAIERSVDPVEAARAENDQQFIRSIKDTAGRPVFPRSLKQALPVPDPEGPPEFDLTKLDQGKDPNDPTRAYWSIAIAAYTVDASPVGPDAGKSRKQLAVESVLEARKQGVPAFYYNGENVSTVCVGAWPRDAILEQESKEVKEVPESETPFVSSAPIPDALREQLEGGNGNIRVYQPKIVVKDAGMMNTWKNFPVYSVNGEDQINNIRDPATGKSQARPQQTFLVEIPRLRPSLLNGTAAPSQSNTDDTGPSMLSPLNPSGGGQLRSLTK